MGRVVAAVNCSGLTSRVEPEEMVKTRVPALRHAADQISTALERYPALIHSVYSHR
jgi:IclR family pca regulon transcriptional regulator